MKNNSGIKAINIYVYDKYGKFYKEFESQSDFSKYFDLPKNYFSKNVRLLNGEYIVKIPSKELFACREKIGRNKILRYVKKLNSKFIKKRSDEDRNIGCYNLNGELIAMFKGEFYLKALLGKSSVCILEKHSKSPNKDIYFVYDD